MPRTTKRKPAPAAPERVSAGSTGLSVPEDRARAIAAAHLAGVPIKRICEEFGTSHHTIAGIIRNRPELLDQARDITARNWKTLAALGTASLIDRLPEMKDHALTVMSAIATEKAELLGGNPTQRIEHVQAPSADEWLDVVDGVIVESDPAMGNAGRTRAPKAPAPRQPAALPAPDGEQPPVSDCSVSVGSDGVPVFEPDEDRFLPPPPPAGLGGAGVRSSSKPTYPDSTDDEKFFSKT
jgi:hypothetical protein